MDQLPTLPGKGTASPLSPPTPAMNRNLEALSLVPHKAQKVFLLFDLPVELIKRISQYLAAPWLPFSLGKPRRDDEDDYDSINKDLLLADDFLTFRLTCSWINDATFDFFRRTYFTSRKVDLKCESLTDLVNIAEHPKLGRHMQGLKISPHFDDDGELDEYKWLEKEYCAKGKAKEADYDPKQWSHMRKSFDKLGEAVRASHDNDQYMRASGLDPALLGRALSGFSGLWSIEYGLYRDDVRNPKLHRFDWKTAKLWEAAKIREVANVAGFSNLFGFMASKDLEEWTNHRPDGLNTVITAIVASRVSLSSLRLKTD